MLVNNAGVGAGPSGSGREVSADGHELRLAVDCLAPVALSRALLPVPRANTPARIVNVGSAGREPLDFDDPEFTAAVERAEQAIQASPVALGGVAPNVERAQLQATRGYRFIMLAYDSLIIDRAARAFLEGARG